MDVGYWLSDNEAWYQKRLDQIRDCGTRGRDLCITASRWRNTLKYFKETGKVVAANQQSAKAWLDNALIR